MNSKKEALERLQRCREEMSRLGLAGVIVPTADPHLSEYVPADWKLRQALSGFTGSAGTLLVADDAAALLADSRYWEQAEVELPGEISLLKLTGDPGAMIAEWFAGHVVPGNAVGADMELLSAAFAKELSETFAREGIELRGSFPDWKVLWPERPLPRLSSVREMKRPGRSRQEKLSAVRALIRETGASAVLLTLLDDVAWVTNLRGDDVPNNPVFLANLLVNEKEAVLFLDAKRLSPGVEARLLEDGISLASPENLLQVLRHWAKEWKILLDPERTNAEFVQQVPAERLVCGASPVMMLKCRKSPEEIAAICEAHERDAVALAEFYAELDERLLKGERVTEADCARMLHAWRAKDEEFFEESFPTIAAFGPNAAFPHYTAPEEGGALLEGNGLLLIDSGGQYECGTTDITRMTPVGTPTDAMKRDCGLVTRAMLRLLKLRFPEGSTGAGIDLAARIDLWSEGLDFGHGTGHGVGYVLNVHEGPVTISPRARAIPLAPGNVLSDEPGLYRVGRWGIRVENLMVCQKDIETEFGKFLKFEALTMMPIDTRTLPEPFGDLAEDLNRFNEERTAFLKPRVSERCRRWLERAVKPVSHS